MRLGQIVLSLAVTTATLAGLAGCSNAQTRSMIDLVNDVGGKDVSAEVCAEFHCEQAVRKDGVTLLKFAHIEEAKMYADALGGDGAQIDPLVIDFTGTDLTVKERLAIIETLYYTHVDYPD